MGQPTAPTAANVTLNPGRKLVAGYLPSISPDGTKIQFGDLSGNLFLCDSSGAGTIKIASECNISSASWSPNGQEIAIFKGYGVNLKLVAISVNSNVLRDLSPNDTITYPPLDKAKLMWSPMGDMIAFFIDSQPTSFLKIIKSDGSGALLNKFVSRAFCWSPTGTEFISTSGYPDSGILHEGTPGSATFSKIGVSDFFDDLLWQPGGTAIAYLDFGENLAYYNLSSQVKTTVQSMLLPAQITISPDGTKTAYTKQDSNGGADSPPIVSLYLVGSKSAVISLWQSGLNFAWSSNSRDIYYEYNGWIYKTSIP